MHFACSFCALYVKAADAKGSLTCRRIEEGRCRRTGISDPP